MAMCELRQTNKENDISGACYHKKQHRISIVDRKVEAKRARGKQRMIYLHNEDWINTVIGSKLNLALERHGCRRPRA